MLRFERILLSKHSILGYEFWLWIFLQQAPGQNGGMQDWQQHPMFPGGLPCQVLNRSDENWCFQHGMAVAGGRGEIGERKHTDLLSIVVSLSMPDTCVIRPGALSGVTTARGRAFVWSSLKGLLVGWRLHTRTTGGQFNWHNFGPKIGPKNGQRFFITIV